MGKDFEQIGRLNRKIACLWHLIKMKGDLLSLLGDVCRCVIWIRFFKLFKWAVILGCGEDWICMLA